MISGKKNDVENPRESVYILHGGLSLRFFPFLKLLSLLRKVPSLLKSATLILTF